MLQTTFKVAAFIWLGTTVVCATILGSLYLFETAVRAMRRKRGRLR